jgi:predicted glycosyltransferase
VKTLDATKKAIWIDLDNSPHVPLFAPVIRHFRSKSIEVILSARDHAQTIELLDMSGFKGTFSVIGRHYGKDKLSKIKGLLVRALRLASFIRKQDLPVAVAVSHGSRSMVLAAWWLKIPIITMYDYEFTETTIFNRFSDRVLVPDAIPDKVLNEIGLAAAKRVRYKGLKEELYTAKFQPIPDFRRTFLEQHGRAGDVGNTIAVVRPPATTANYHSEKSEVLFDDILHFMLNSDVLMVVTPRTPDQAKQIRNLIKNVPDARERCIILDKAVNGLELVSAADLVISGGGTMNREAALLGVPVYSFFAGRQGALDRQMESDGLITFIRDTRDLAKIRLEHRDRQKPTALTDRVEKFVIEQIDSMLIQS